MEAAQDSSVKQADSSSKNRLGWMIWALIVPLLGLAPLASFRFAELIGDSTRWITLVGFPVGFFLWYSRQNRTGERLLISRCRLSTGILVAAALLYLFAVWFFSAWLACFCMLLVVTAWSIQANEGVHGASSCAWCLLFAVALGLPGGWAAWLDESLIYSACGLCSYSLDAVGAPNIQLGNNVELIGTVLLGDQLCGGWANLYTVSMFTVIILVLRRRPLFAGILSLLLLPFFVIAMHYTKLLGVAVGHIYLGRDLSNGLDYTLLDLGCLGMTVMLIWAFSHALAVLSEPVVLRRREFGPIFEYMNRALCWPGRLPVVAPEDPEERERFEAHRAEQQRQLDSMPKVHWHERAVLRNSVIVASVVILLAGLAPAAVIMRGSARPSINRPELPEATVQRLENVELPERLDELTIQLVEEPDDNREAWKSRAWIVSDGKFNMRLAVRYSFVGWHDPTEELVRRGWTVGVKAKNETTDVLWSIFGTLIQNDLGSYVYVFSSMADASLTPIDVVPNYQRNSEATDAAQRKNILDLLRGEKRNSDQATVEILLRVDSGENLRAEDVERYFEIYDKLRKALLK